MEIGDTEQANETFEFDLSDVDVAAFESVVTEDTLNPAHDQHAQPQPPQLEQHHLQESTSLSEPPLQHHTLQPVSPRHLQQLDHQHHQESPPTLRPSQINSCSSATTLTQEQIHQSVASQLSSASNLGGSKIILIPINSKGAPGAPGYKHLLQQLQLIPQPNHQQQISSPPTPNKSSQSSSPTSQQQQQQQQQQPQPPRSQQHQLPKRKPCNCTKSQCLKLYCDCFANGEFCSGCNCTNCFNSLSKEKERQKAITNCLERNPEAFRPKIGKAVKAALGDQQQPAPESIERRHTKGCNCKRSGCLKNYCECYEAKILCSNLCKCCGCKNYEESFERKSLMQLANSNSDNARGILKNLLPSNNYSSSGSTGKDFTKCFITDKVIRASLTCLLQSAQQAERDGVQPNSIPSLLQAEMGKCLRMIVDSASESSSPKRR